MIVKLENQFYNSIHMPVMLILSEQEKRGIAAMDKNQIMIAFYPTDKGYTTELINEWMRDGIQIDMPKPVVEDDFIPEYIPPVGRGVDDLPQEG